MNSPDLAALTITFVLMEGLTKRIQLPVVRVTTDQLGRSVHAEFARSESVAARMSD